MYISRKLPSFCIDYGNIVTEIKVIFYDRKIFLIFKNNKKYLISLVFNVYYTKLKTQYLNIKKVQFIKFLIQHMILCYINVPIYSI